MFSERYIVVMLILWRYSFSILLYSRNSSRVLCHHFIDYNHAPSFFKVYKIVNQNVLIGVLSIILPHVYHLRLAFNINYKKNSFILHRFVIELWMKWEPESWNSYSVQDCRWLPSSYCKKIEKNVIKYYSNCVYIAWVSSKDVQMASIVNNRYVFKS